MATSAAARTVPGAVPVRYAGPAVGGRVRAWRAVRRRRALAAGLTRVGSRSATRAGISAAVAVDAAAVGLARGELDAVTVRLRASGDMDVSALRLIERLLCDPASALYRSRWPGELREQLLCVLAALDPAPSSAPTAMDR